MIQRIKRLFVCSLLAAFTFVGFTHSVHAAMIGTDQVHAANASSENQQKILAALERPEVISQLEQLGVTKEDAHARVAALSNEEAAAMAGQLDSLPAGGDVLGAVLLVFLVLVATDLLGVTSVFPFLRPRV